MVLASPSNMSKRGGNHPIPGHFKVQGAPVEARDAARASKQALGRQEARKKRRAGRKTRLGEAPPAQRAKEPRRGRATVSPPSSTVTAAAHDREFARMNERRPGHKRVKRSDGAAEE